MKKSSTIIESIEASEFISMYESLQVQLTRIETLLTGKIRPELTLSELSREKGYGKSRLREIIRNKAIPFTLDGKEIVIKREDADRIRPKAIKKNN